MTPDWNQAPEWAQWVARDKDGSWWWFEFAPMRERGFWDSLAGQYQRVKPENHTTICHPRPTTENER